jgi:hypothetical protein
MGHAASQAREAQALMPFDEMLTVGTSPESIGTAFQTSRLSQSEIYISGGTGDVLWQSPNGNAGAASIAVLGFSVNSPTPVRIRYELSIDTTSFRSWTAGAGLHIARGGIPIVNIEAVSRSEGMEFYPPGTFEIGADGYARTIFDEVLTFLPGAGYELRTDASSRCPGPAALDTCTGKPISFTTQLRVVPEPPTWLAAMLTVMLLWGCRRFRHQLSHFGK